MDMDPEASARAGASPLLKLDREIEAVPFAVIGTAAAPDELTVRLAVAVARISAADCAALASVTTPEAEARICDEAPADPLKVMVAAPLPLP